MNFINRFAVTTLTILIGTLISDYAVQRLSKEFGHTYKGVAIGMAVTVVIFYPLFTFLERYIKKISTQYIQKSKRITKSAFWGLMLGFTFAIIILFVMFASVWYGLKIPTFW